MRKMFAVLSAVIIMITVALPKAAAAGLKEISQNMPFRMTVLGDSIAAGYGLDGHDRSKEPCYECASYANTLAQKYGLTAGESYINDAVSGATTSDLITQIGSKSVNSHIKNCDTIIISIGGNDLLAVLWSAIESQVDIPEGTESFEEVVSSMNPMQLIALAKNISESVPTAVSGFESNFKTLMGKIRAANPEALVIVQTIYNPFESFEQIEALQRISADALGSMNKVITDNAGSLKYTVCDVAATLAGKANETTNIRNMDIHPNAEGHRIISELLDSEITSHTFTTWVINDESSVSDNEKAEKKRTALLIFGFFFMLIILVTIMFLNAMHKLKDQ